ncbi:MAG: transcription antitermination factor NusB [candidate division WOR-3 bacterium]|nr:MAG: transcription antitermination factor NusB [candidate division WOR-3 bacterium]
MGRRLARELALKVLYRYEEGDADLQGAMKSVLETKVYYKNDKDFSKMLIERTVENIKKIDKEIINVLQNWEYDRISVVDKIILRMGACELIYFDDIPSQISINEAIEIGKKYGGIESGRFINGVLDAIRKCHESSDNQ